jgi:hypothetical protein
MYDPIVEEIRRYRDEHARRFGYDLDAICADLMVSQQHSAHALIDRKVQPRAADLKRSGDRNAKPSRS